MANVEARELSQVSVSYSLETVNLCTAIQQRHKGNEHHVGKVS